MPAQGVATRICRRPAGGVAALLLVACAAVAVVSPARAAAPIKVIVGKDNPVRRLERDELSRIYLGRKTLWESGQRIAPAMLDDSSSAADAFLRGTVAKTPSQFRSYWKRQLFSGGGAPPRTFATSGQVAEFVARQPGAIGIVDATFADTQVTAIRVDE